MKKYLPPLAALLLSFAAGFAQSTARDQPTGSLSFACPELSFDSFPPNQLLRMEQKDGSAISILNAERAGTWAEFFVQIDKPGTYNLGVTALGGPDKGTFQTIVNGDPVGDPLDCYTRQDAVTHDYSIGDTTFLKPGNYGIRFVATGKNSSSGGYGCALQRITLTPTSGFTLLSPNGSCQPDGNVWFRWNPWPAAKQYRVELDGTFVADVSAPATDYPAQRLAPGAHRWRVIAVTKDGSHIPSNIFSFVVGDPPAYLYGNYSDDFSPGTLSNWTLESMKPASSSVGAPGALQADGAGSAVLKNVALEKWEGEVSAVITPASADSAAGVGFQAADGTRLYAVLDVGRGQFRIERRVKGYSIFEVTPAAYQRKGWAERKEGDAMVWEIGAAPVAIRPASSYTVKLAFSRRSACVMGTLIPSDGSPTLTLRELTDSRTPDRPALFSLTGKSTFNRMAFTHLNPLVYKWDPDSYRIVLRPGPPGSWDAKGAFNPAVLIRDGTWYMIYRGNAVPAPPNGPPASDLGLATSIDGVHWVKSAANPVVARQGPRDSQEDPDILWPEGSDCVYLENVTLSHRAEGLNRGGVQEVMRTSKDWTHWGEPWVLNSGKTWGKIGGMIDTHNKAGLGEVVFNGVAYRYVAMIEEGRIDLSNDLRTWVKAGTADLVGESGRWCDAHECSGDIFVDADHNIRYESQSGVKVDGKNKGSISGNALCTITEGVLSGTNPTRVLWKSDLPWLPDWYGDAPTGAPEDFTSSNGSVFPGQTVIKDGWLWHFSGGNNAFTVLSKCWYRPLLECRNLQTSVDANHQCMVTVTVRNIGSLNGMGKVRVTLDGRQVLEKDVTLDRDTETKLRFPLSVPAGIHTVAVDDIAMTVER